MDTVTLTYDELAERLLITRKSAQNLTRKRGWTRTTGNDGKVRVTMPLDALPQGGTEGATDAPPKTTPEAPLHGPQLVELLQESAVLKVKLEASELAQEALRERLMDVKADRDAWKEQAAQTTALLERQQDTRSWLDKLLGRTPERLMKP